MALAEFEVAVSLAAARWHVRLRAFVPLPLDHADKRNLSASMLGQTCSRCDRAVCLLRNRIDLVIPTVHSDHSRCLSEKNADCGLCFPAEG